MFRRAAARLTDFLDPRQQVILKSVIGRNEEVNVAFSGGFSEAERKRALILPPYAGEEDFDLSFVEVVYSSRFAALTHAQLLGALMGTGVDRSKIGDLIVSDGQVQFVCAGEIEPYLRLNLTSVGRTAVSCRTITADRLIHMKENWQNNEGTVSALRLDAVLAELYRLPRSRVSDLISRGLAKVNWQIVEKRDFEIREGDVLSLRGHGRSKIISVQGLTKKNKIRLQYGKLV